MKLPDPMAEDSWDDLDHLLGICNCLPPHDYLYDAKDQKAAINAYTTNKIIEARIDELKRADNDLGVVLDKYYLKDRIAELRKTL